MSGIGTPELIIIILWLVCLYFITKFVLFVIKTSKRVEKLEKTVKKLEEKNRG